MARYRTRRGEPEIPRYLVEQGTDGSWLIVDRGEHGDQRVALSRERDQQTAALEADVLSQMEGLTSQLGAPSGPRNSELERVLNESTAAVDEQHTFNHLLPDQH